MNEKYYGYGLPIDISTHGWQLDRIFYVLHVFMVLLFVGWFIFLVYTLVKFRARPGHTATYAPMKSKAASYLEMGVVLFEAFLLIGLAIPAWRTAKAALPSGPDVFRVRVVAEQFAWNIHYPGDDGQFGRTKPELVSSDNPVGLDSNDAATKDDYVSINELYVPVNRPVLIDLTSKDVIHSFSLPVARVKQDAVPGMSFPVYFTPKETGDFEIACAQLCGLGHYRMRGQFYVKTEEEVKSWLKEQIAASQGATP
jgi:cytochrome c oxidase subunit 2